MDRPARWHDYITINIYWLGLSAVSQTLTPIVVPLLVQQFVGESAKGSFYGTLRLWSLMIALLVQASMGIVSDRSRLPWGRRRPFIFIGTLLDLVLIAAIGFTAGLEGLTGYWVLFALILLLQVASNIAQSAQNGLIPDLVPMEKRGRFSSVKAVFEVPLPLIIISFTVARLIGRGNLWAGLLITMGLVTLAMIITMFAPEKRYQGEAPPLDLRPFGRLVVMTALFTAVILGMGALVRWFSGLIAAGSSVLGVLAPMGAIGLLSMAVAVALGVWLSIRVGIQADDPQVKHAFTWWVINRLAFLVGANNLGSFTIYFLQGRLGYQREQAASPAAMLTMFVGVFILISVLPSGWLADRFGRKRIVAAAALTAALGVLIALLVPNLTVIYIGGCFIGAGMGLFYTANWALGTEIVPKEKAGQYLGVANLAGAGAGAVGAYIGGPIADFVTVQLPQAPGMGYLLLFAIYGLLFLLSLLALATVKEPAANP
jgi:MFS family permease